MGLFSRNRKTHPTITSLFEELGHNGPPSRLVQNTTTLQKDIVRKAPEYKTFKPKSGLNKSQQIQKANVTKTALIPPETESNNLNQMALNKAEDTDPSHLYEIIAKKDKQIAESKVLENQIRKAITLLIEKLKKRDENLAQLNKKYQAAAKKLKALENESLAHKTAINIYRKELKAKGLKLERIGTK